MNTNEVKVYNYIEAMNLIKKKYPYIPFWIIERVLHANDLYLFSINVIDFKPTLDMWHYPKKKR